jgi:general stress protein 26
MSQRTMKHFIGLLARFDHAMLVTKRGSALRSRPMAIAGHTDDGRIRFITRDDSAKLEELEEDDQVNVAMQSEERFLSISGHARLTKDRALIDKIWQQRQAVWFAQGRRDPHAIVLEVVPTYAEYWDRADFTVLDLIAERTRAGVDEEAGQKAESDSHGTVDLRGEPL